MVLHDFLCGRVGHRRGPITESRSKFASAFFVFIPVNTHYSLPKLRLDDLRKYVWLMSLSG